MFWFKSYKADADFFMQKCLELSRENANLASKFNRASLIINKLQKEKKMFENSPGEPVYTDNKAEEAQEKIDRLYDALNKQLDKVREQNAKIDGQKAEYNLLLKQCSERIQKFKEQLRATDSQRDSLVIQLNSLKEENKKLRGESVLSIEMLGNSRIEATQLREENVKLLKELDHVRKQRNNTIVADTIGMDGLAKQAVLTLIDIKNILEQK